MTLPAGATTVEFDYRAGWNLNHPMAAVPTMAKTFVVEVEPTGGGPALQSTTVLTAMPGTVTLDTGALGETVDISAFAGQSVRLSFEWFVPESFTGPAFFQLDNVLVSVAVPTLPQWAAMVLSLLLAAAGVLLLRRRQMATPEV